MPHAPKGSMRLERISAAIAHEITQYIIIHMDDNRLKQAQISRVSISKDLSHAKVYFMVADKTIDTKQLGKLLNNAAGIFRHHLASTLDLRVTPEVKFYFDEDATKRDHLLDLLSKI